MTVTATTTKPSWQFLWARLEDGFPEDKKWYDRVYRAASIEEACDKMLNWIKSRSGEIVVDYEARAEHIPYAQDRHQDTFPNLNRLEHPIRDYIA